MPLQINSSIMSTVLMRAKELAYLAPQNADAELRSLYHSDFQQFLSDSGNASYVGLMPSQISEQTGTLASLIEQLFKNITISLMSSPELQYVRG